MISRDEALAEALAALHDRLSARALAYIGLAGELRAQPEPAGARLTLHDVEAQTCPHSMIAIRDRRAPTSWWLHVDNHTTCTELS